MNFSLAFKKKLAFFILYQAQILDIRSSARLLIF